MRPKILSKIQDMESRMLAYIGSMSYNFCQLCVKNDPSALLGFEVIIQGEQKHLEDLANVYLHTKEEDGDDKTYEIYPKIPDYISFILQGGMQSHPEFKFKTEQVKDEGEEESDNTSDEDDELERTYVTATVPDVDKNRHDVIMDAIDVLKEACTANLERMNVKYTAEIAPLLVSLSPDAQNEAKDRLKETFENSKKMMDQVIDEKKKEVEDAYQEYLGQHTADDVSTKNDGKTGIKIDDVEVQKPKMPKFGQSLKLE